MKQTIAWPATGPIRAGTVTIVLLLLAVLLWGLRVQIDGAVVVQGVVQAKANRQIVQHPEGGVVAKIMVSDGHEVSAGAVLIQLDDTQLAAERAIIESQLVETRARRARLEAARDGASTVTMPADLLATAEKDRAMGEQIDGQLRLFQAEWDTVVQQTGQLVLRKEQTSSQIRGIDAQIAALTDQRALLLSEIADQKSLQAKGLAQASRVLALERERASLDGRLGELAASRAEALDRLAEFEAQILGLRSAWREEASVALRDIGLRELELIQRRHAVLDRIAGLAIRAPVAGTVLGLAVTAPRAVIRPADPLLFIIPKDGPLIVTAQIPPAHIDEVRVGASVHVTFSGLPKTAARDFVGVVETVSADALVDQNNGHSFYRAEIGLPADQVLRLGGHLLRPGMPVDTFISTGSRTPMAWLIEPFLDYFHTAFRES